MKEKKKARECYERAVMMGLKKVRGLRTNLVYWLVLILILLGVSYSQRWVLMYKFEPDYWENYYYESQWNVANSKREIPDEGVYRYIGYRLVNGENPFNVDYWVPPLGKYLYGLGAKYLANPYFISFGLYIGGIILVGLISRLIFKDKKIGWLAIYLFALNPLVVDQLSLTMLDLPLMVAFLAHVLFLIRFEKNKKYREVVWAGIFLGMMAGIKPPFFIPMIVLVDIWYLWQIGGIRAWGLFLPSIAGGYMAAYFCYFMRHPNPIPWLRLHQKIFDFQKGQAGSHSPLNIFRIIFLGRFKGLLGANFVEMKMSNWSTVLPLGVIASICFLIKKNVTKHKDWWQLYLAILAVGYVLMNLFIDVWPRYLVPLLVILILITTCLFKNKKWILGLLILSYMPFLKPFFFPSPKPVLESFSRHISLQSYKEAYRMLSDADRKTIDEVEWQDRLTAAEFKETGKDEIKLVKENNQWRVKWDWDYLNKTTWR